MPSSSASYLAHYITPFGQSQLIRQERWPSRWPLLACCKYGIGRPGCLWFFAEQQALSFSGFSPEEKARTQGLKDSRTQGLKDSRSQEAKKSSHGGHGGHGVILLKHGLEPASSDSVVREFLSP